MISSINSTGIMQEAVAGSTLLKTGPMSEEEKASSIVTEDDARAVSEHGDTLKIDNVTDEDSDSDFSFTKKDDKDKVELEYNTGYEDLSGYTDMELREMFLTGQISRSQYNTELSSRNEDDEIENFNTTSYENSSETEKQNSQSDISLMIEG